MRPASNALRWAAFAVAALILLASLPRPSEGCTLWAATGKPVGFRGTVIAKNRDNSKGSATELRFVRREKGFAFAGLFDPEADGYVVAGINEKGLVVVNASATSLPAEKRNVAKEDLTERILVSFASVNAVVRERTMFAESHPAFYMVADAGKTAVIEVAPGGRVSVKSTRSGTLTHTNHYVSRALRGVNERPAKGSRKRLSRINHLLSRSHRPLSLEKFIALSRDGSDGHDDAIFVPCSGERNVCTLSTWVASLPKDGNPEIYLAIVKPDYTEAAERLRIDGKFWERVLPVPLP